MEAGFSARICQPFNEARRQQKRYRAMPNITIVITKDRQPRSFRWGIRAGVNQPNELPLSRAEGSPSDARRAVERLFGPLAWLSAEEEARVDERNGYVVQVAMVETNGAKNE